ncbi:MAG: RagB/SusD family nutrient uptake outer membrane protein [Gemmatimonadales bacterium]
MSLRIRLLMATAAVSLVGLAACTDLTVEPKSSVTEANVFNDLSSYRAFIAKVYTGLAVSGQQGAAGKPDIQGIDEGFSQYLRLLWEAQELPTDEAVIGWGDVGLPEMNTQTWAVDNSFVVSMYYRIFFQVGMANEFLRQTSDEKLAARGHNTGAIASEIATYRAEARFLRALSYWHGIDLFGNIPLLTEADELGSTPPQQATRAQIFDFVVSELTEIQSQLPAATAANYGRATGAAASMLLAKLYHNAAVYTGTANYAGVLSALQPVLAGSFSLDASYSHLFQADNNTSPEIIFFGPAGRPQDPDLGRHDLLVHVLRRRHERLELRHHGCWWGSVR